VLDDETEITAYCNPLRGVKETAGARLVSRRMVESGMEHRFVVGGFGMPASGRIHGAASLRTSQFGRAGSHR
jgi:hypothetical protein